MRFVFGAADFPTFERGQDRCYLLANGLGGYSSLTAIGSCARNDHALLMSGVDAANQRHHLVSALAEVVSVDGNERSLLTAEYADGTTADGYLSLSAFTVDPLPTWAYHAGGVEIIKTLAVPHGRDAVTVRYEAINRTTSDATFTVTPLLQFVPKGDLLAPDQAFEFDADERGAERGVIRSNSLTLRLATNGRVSSYSKRMTADFFYAHDERDGRPGIGRAAHMARIDWQIPAGQRAHCTIQFDAAEITQEPATQFEAERARQAALAEQSGLADPPARLLAAAADQFIITKPATGAKTIVAGYPYFLDWGRDTMIALLGIIAARRFDQTREILRTFVAHLKDGLMPNLFPEGEGQARYNTVDAALLFVNVLWEYVEASGDEAFAAECFDAVAAIIANYRAGTHFSIAMDDDGLISAGSGLDQVTWMDVDYQGILPTPRHGKPVEINAYWYSALRVADALAARLVRDGQDYAELAERVRESFLTKFWLEDRGCLADLAIEPGDENPEAARQVRCNQIWALTQPFGMLSDAQARAVVDRVFELLWTPVGLRSLEPGDGQFHATYSGPQSERDMAYHQGTSWGFPLGAYYVAYLRVNGHSEQARADVRRQLAGIEATLIEGCVGQIAEVFDGGRPTISKGCFAQAWSVTEMLRAYAALEGR